MTDTDRTYEADEPRPMTWGGVEMWRCPVERCGWSNEDKDNVIDHIRESGHRGPDPEPEPDEEPIPSESVTSDQRSTSVEANEGGS